MSLDRLFWEVLVFFRQIFTFVATLKKIGNTGVVKARLHGVHMHRNIIIKTDSEVYRLNSGSILNL